MSLRRAQGFTVLELMIVVAIIGLLVMLSYPAISEARVRSEETACLSNLRTLHGAKESWIFDRQLQPEPMFNNPVTMADLVPCYIKREPLCPAGGTYWLRRPGEGVRCSIAGGHRP